MLYKYPRTPHMLTSPGATKDDTRVSNYAQFEGRQVVATLKLDGENTSLYRTTLHSRSIHGANRPWHDRIKAFHASIAYGIPEGWRLCGENVEWVHSIAYQNVQRYFYLFSIWNDSWCLDWDSTIEWATTLNLLLVPVLYEGAWNETLISSLAAKAVLRGHEGIVVRTRAGFPYAAITPHVVKYVRPNHVQTNDHWTNTLARNPCDPEHPLRV